MNPKAPQVRKFARRITLNRGADGRVESADILQEMAEPGSTTLKTIRGRLKVNRHLDGRIAGADIDGYVESGEERSEEPEWTAPAEALVPSTDAFRNQNRAARHEAGHLLACEALGLLASASIWQEADGAWLGRGSVSWTGYETKADRQLIAVAGAVAEGATDLVRAVSAVDWKTSRLAPVWGPDMVRAELRFRKLLASEPGAARFEELRKELIAYDTVLTLVEGINFIRPDGAPKPAWPPAGMSVRARGEIATHTSTVWGPDKYFSREAVAKRKAEDRRIREAAKAVLAKKPLSDAERLARIPSLLQWPPGQAGFGPQARRR